MKRWNITSLSLKTTWLKLKSMHTVLWRGTEVWLNLRFLFSSYFCLLYLLSFLFYSCVLFLYILSTLLARSIHNSQCSCRVGAITVWFWKSSKTSRCFWRKCSWKSILWTWDEVRDFISQVAKGGNSDVFAVAHYFTGYSCALAWCYIHVVEGWKLKTNYPTMAMLSRLISSWWILKNLWKIMSVRYNLLR